MTNRTAQPFGKIRNLPHYWVFHPGGPAGIPVTSLDLQHTFSRIPVNRINGGVSTQPKKHPHPTTTPPATSAQVCPINSRRRCQIDGSASKTVAGWTVGGGIEAALGSQWTVKADYLYANFDGAAPGITADNPVFGGQASTSRFTQQTDDLSFHIGRIGLNYKF